MKPAEKLDEVLKYLLTFEGNVANEDDIIEHFKNQIPSNEILLILIKLVKDGFALDKKYPRINPKPVPGTLTKDSVHVEINEVRFGISFDGKYFLVEEKGYTQKKINDESDRVLADGRDRRLSTGTVLLAVGTFLLLAWELAKYFYFDHHCF